MNRFHNQSSLLVCDTNIRAFLNSKNRFLSVFLFKYQFFYDLGISFADLREKTGAPDRRIGIKSREAGLHSSAPLNKI